MYRLKYFLEVLQAAFTSAGSSSFHCFPLSFVVELSAGWWGGFSYSTGELPFTHLQTAHTCTLIPLETTFQT
jgi:hypothetical protein